jgi:hypothetical protein
MLSFVTCPAVQYFSHIINGMNFGVKGGGLLNEEGVI